MGSFNPIYKPWGHTVRLPMPNGSEVHVAYINKGGESSWHCHKELVNVFYVVKGKLRITQEVGPDMVLEAGDICTVETGNRHDFYAFTDSIVVEGYGSVDIDRSKVN